MIRWLYNLCFPVAFLILLPGYLHRMVRRGSFRRHFWQRLGFFPADLRARLAACRPQMWLQAVSVGEMLVALKLIAALRELDPQLTLVLSTTTTTGFQLARERAPADVEVIYTPIDSLGAVRRTFRAVRPGQVVIVDGGLWPNQLWEARKRGIPTALVNARLSPRSERRFRKFRPLAAAIFRSLDLVAVAEERDVERWKKLGVPSENLHRTGSVKFDDAAVGSTATSPSPDTSAGLRALLQGAGVAPDAPILLAGSTHSGEEKTLGTLYMRLRQTFPGLFLIVAPRHVERATNVRTDLEAIGLRVCNRTALPRGEKCGDVLLIDTTGELREWYFVATLVFVGKSLTAVGGQNPAEAVAAGKPVLFGPHMENFEEFVNGLLAIDGAVQVHDAGDLEAACARLLAAPESARKMADRARRQLEAHRGAARRTAALLLAQGKVSPCESTRSFPYSDSRHVTDAPPSDPIVQRLGQRTFIP